MRKICSILFLVIMMMMGSILHSPFGRAEKKPEPESRNPYQGSEPDSTSEPFRAHALLESPIPTMPSETGKPVRTRQSDKPLAGKVICVDPGHQSIMKWQKVPIAPGESRSVRDFSIGTKGVATGVFEYTVVLQVSKKLRTELEKLGARVILTRERVDELVSNIDRAEMANKANADIFIRIHCDGSEIPEARGISVLYPGDRYIDDSTLLEESLALSESLLEGAVQATQAKNRGLFERNDQVGFNYCKVPCTLIEMGFMTNPEEDRLLNSEAYQEKLVRGMVNGISEYLEKGK